MLLLFIICSAIHDGAAFGVPNNIPLAVLWLASTVNNPEVGSYDTLGWASSVMRVMKSPYTLAGIQCWPSDSVILSKVTSSGVTFSSAWTFISKLASRASFNFWRTLPDKYCCAVTSLFSTGSKNTKGLSPVWSSAITCSGLVLNSLPISSESTPPVYASDNVKASIGVFALSTLDGLLITRFVKMSFGLALAFLTTAYLFLPFESVPTTSFTAGSKLASNEYNNAASGNIEMYLLFSLMYPWSFTNLSYCCFNKALFDSMSGASFNSAWNWARNVSRKTLTALRIP